MAAKRRRDKYNEIQEAGYGSGRKPTRIDRLSEEECALFEAVTKGRTAKCKRLLESGTNPNIRNEMGSTPLHIAAESSNASEEGVSELLVALLHCGADPNATDRWGSTALHMAACSSLANVQVLLEAGAFIDAQDHAGMTPLMTALQAEGGPVLEVVRLLVESGCNVHLRCTEGCTGLHMLAWNSTLSLSATCQAARMLLNVGLSATAEDKKGQQPICYELRRFDTFGHNVKRSDLALVELLVQAGATLNLQNRRHRECVQHCLNFMEASFNWQLLQIVSPALRLDTLRRLPRFLTQAANQLGVTEDMKRYLQERGRTVRSLRASCRQCLRELFKGKVLCRMQTLGLPTSIRNYVCNLDDEFVFVPSGQR